MSDDAMSDARVRMLKLAQALRIARGREREPYASVGLMRCGEGAHAFFVSAHITGCRVCHTDEASCATVDEDAGVYAFGPTPDAAVDAAIATWRRAMSRHRAKAHRAAEDAVDAAARWDVVCAVIDGEVR